MPTSEQDPNVEFLQERGGLTVAHWEEVIRRMGRAKEPVGAKVVAYGQKVITGEFPDDNFHYRDFLGRRHWNTVFALDKNDVVRIPRIFPPWPRKSYVVNQQALEARQFAEYEQMHSYTMNDYFESIKNHKYSYVEIEYEVSKPDHGYFIDEVKKGMFLDDKSVKEALALYLLTIPEVTYYPQNHLWRLPQRLYQQSLRELQIDPEKMLQRLRAQVPQLRYLHNSPHFGILEKEVV